MLVFTANLAAVGVCSRIIAAEKQFLEFLCIYTCGECMYACVARGFFVRSRGNGSLMRMMGIYGRGTRFARSRGLITPLIRGWVDWGFREMEDCVCDVISGERFLFYRVESSF